MFSPVGKLRSLSAMAVTCLSLVLMLCVALSGAQDTCIKDSRAPASSADCRCILHNGSYVDLSPLMKDRPASETYRFSGPSPKKPDIKYYYSPCTGFTQPFGEKSSNCKDVAVCQSTQDKNHYNLGTEDTAVFKGSPQAPDFSINYNGSEDRVAIVMLKCSPKDTTFTVIGEAPPKTYTFMLETPAACLHAPKKGLSTGSVMVIIFFVLLFVYIVGGFLFLRFVRGARGLEQIPNYTFWADFPSLVKDGVMFLCRGCRTEQGYNEI